MTLCIEGIDAQTIQGIGMLLAQAEMPRGFRRALHRADRILNDLNTTRRLISNAARKLERASTALAQVRGDMQTLFRLVTAWMRGDYRRAPWQSVLYAAAAIVYFVTPIDVIPDFIPVFGFSDDLSVVLFVLSTIAEDLERYRQYEREKTDAGAADHDRHSKEKNHAA